MLGWLPEDVSPYGADIDALFYFIYYLTAAAFIIVTALMLIFLYVYRDQGGRRAAYTHGNTAMEIIWTIIPAIVFISLGLVSRSLWEEIKLEPPETDIVVKVTGKQFNWEILYPGPDGEFDTADDKQIDNDIRVPAGKPVRVVLASKDVIHSFFMPNLRFKQDMVPGREIIGWFQANKPGKYEIPCAELCGFGHSGMKGWLYALAPEEYQAWRDEQWPQTASSNGSHATLASPASNEDAGETAAPAPETVSTEEAAVAAAAVGTAVGEASEAAQSAPDTAKGEIEATQEAVSEAQDSAEAATEAMEESTSEATQDAAPEAIQDTSDASDTSGAATEAAEDAADVAGGAKDTATEAVEAAQDTAIEATQDATEGAQEEETATEAVQETVPGAASAVEEEAKSTSVSPQQQRLLSEAASAVAVATIADSTVQAASIETQPAQEAPAEQSSPEAISKASGQDSPADASSENATSQQYAFTTTAVDQGGPCKGQLEILSGATIYDIAGEFYTDEKRLLGVDLIRDYNTHIKNLDHIYPGQKLCIPTLAQTTRLRQEQESGSYNLILDAFRSSRKAKALARSVQQKGYRASVIPRQVSNSLLLQRVEITGLQDQTTASQAWELFSGEDLS